MNKDSCIVWHDKSEIMYYNNYPMVEYTIKENEKDNNNVLRLPLDRICSVGIDDKDTCKVNVFLSTIDNIALICPTEERAQKLRQKIRKAILNYAER